jgi:hypothetical protein
MTAKTYTLAPFRVVAVKKSQARIVWAWPRRKAAQVGCPGGAVAFGRGLDPVRPEDLPHRGGCELDADGSEFAVDPSVAPPGVLPGQAQDESLDVATGRWSAGPLATGGVGGDGA